MIETQWYLIGMRIDYVDGTSKHLQFPSQGESPKQALKAAVELVLKHASKPIDDITPVVTGTTPPPESKQHITGDIASLLGI
ncbi:MAG: hypothetical protein HIU83_14230 [Proteobacteria bacterium]|nr:hypothetical protein [Pseudomonadota bacterium]